MKKYLFYLSVLFALTVTAEVQARATEKVTDYTCSDTEDGRVYCVDPNTQKPVTGKIVKGQGDNYISIENFSRGYRDGLCSFFNSEGKIMERTYYKQGIKNGMSKIYYPNRSFRSVVSYKDGNLDGIMDVYAENGQLLGRMKYKKGKLERGYCVNADGKKEDFTQEFIKSQPENELVSCGAQ